MLHYFFYIPPGTIFMLSLILACLFPQNADASAAGMIHRAGAKLHATQVLQQHSATLTELENLRKKKLGLKAQGGDLAAQDKAKRQTLKASLPGYTKEVTKRGTHSAPELIDWKTAQYHTITVAPTPAPLKQEARSQSRAAAPAGEESTPPPSRRRSAWTADDTATETAPQSRRQRGAKSSANKAKAAEAKMAAETAAQAQAPAGTMGVVKKAALGFGVAGVGFGGLEGLSFIPGGLGGKSNQQLPQQPILGYTEDGVPLYQIPPMASVVGHAPDLKPIYSINAPGSYGGSPGGSTGPMPPQQQQPQPMPQQYAPAPQPQAMPQQYAPAPQQPMQQQQQYAPPAPQFYTDANGNSVNQFGQVVDQYGNPAQQFFTDAYGNTVDQYGNPMQ